MRNRRTLGNRVIDLGNTPAAVQNACRIWIFCGGAQPRGILVKPVYGTERNVRIKRREKVSQRIAAVSRRGVHGHSRRFVENNDVAVLVDHGDVQPAVGFGKPFVFGFQGNNVPRQNGIHSSYGITVPGYAAGDTLQFCSQTP